MTDDKQIPPHGPGDSAPFGVDRRNFLRKAAAAGVIVVPGSMLAACASSGSSTGSSSGSTSTSSSSSAATGSSSSSSSGATMSSKNPLNVDPSKGLDVFIFKGGYGDQYGKDAEAVFKKEFPSANAKFASGQGLGQRLQPAFNGGTPPDVIDNSGANNLDVATLVAQNQISELSDLYAAPSYDIPGKTVEQTLLPGVKAIGEFSGKPYIMNYVYTINSIWHSDALFKKMNWTYPKTWADMLTLCAEIKKNTKMSPWTFQGKYPYYILAPIIGMAAKNGGTKVLVDLDNLESNAWTNDSVMGAAEAFYELADKKYVLPGTPGLTHTQSQTKWAQGQAVFIPCGSWLENELGAITPKGFNMVVNPVPALKSDDKLPYTAVQASAGEGYIVPSHGKNPAAGKEFMRIMLSKQSSTNFSKLTHSLTSLAGYADNLNFSTAFTSANQVVKAAGSNTFYWNFGTWYAQMETAIEGATGSMMAGEIKPKEWAQKCQKAANSAKSDPNVKKYHRNA